MTGRKKVTVVGAGNVGATCALEVARRDYAEVVLVDIVPNFAAGKALDMNQMASVTGYEPTITGSERAILANSLVAAIRNSLLLNAETSAPEWLYRYPLPGVKEAQKGVDEAKFPIKPGVELVLDLVMHCQRHFGAVGPDGRKLD